MLYQLSYCGLSTALTAFGRVQRFNGAKLAILFITDKKYTVNFLYGDLML